MCLGVSDELWCEASRSSVCASKVRRSLVKRCWREAVWSSVLVKRLGQAFWLRNLVMRSCAHTATKRAGVLSPNKQNTLLSTLHVCPEDLLRTTSSFSCRSSSGGSSSGGRRRQQQQWCRRRQRRRRRQLSLRGWRLARWRRRAGRRRARMALLLAARTAGGTAGSAACSSAQARRVEMAHKIGRRRLAVCALMSAP